MNSLELIRHMCEKCGMSMRAVSVKMGKAPTFLSSTLARGGGVGAETLSEVARACGYELHVSGHGETVAVDPRNELNNDTNGV